MGVGTKMRFSLFFIFSCLSSVIITGCTSTQYKVEFPDSSYSIENYQARNLGVFVPSVEFKPNTDQKVKEVMANNDLSGQLQTEMHKSKRFSVVSIFAEEGVEFFKTYEKDTGEVEVVESKSVPKLDLILTLIPVLTVEKHHRAHDNLYIFEVDINANCVDPKTKKVKFAEKAKGQARRKEIISLTGRRMGGFVFSNDNDIRQAFRDAALKAINKIAIALAKYYPVGGEIIGYRSGRFTLNRGKEHGVVKGLMLIFVSEDKVDVPIAVAEATPSDRVSNLKVLRWSTEDDAHDIINEIRKNKWFSHSKCYAISLNTTVPPELNNESEELDRGL